MPIRVVNGATIFVRDVAFAHDGAPPQINMVRVDGANAVLMTILKTGSASTLDVINGVKALLPKLRETLPASLKLDAIGDQSSFVNAAVNSVIFEGVVAAALTGLMILIFLGSWRSTLIITISIPLAILASVAALVRDRRDDQRDDARRSRARGRHSRRRRDGDDREHQLASRAGQGHRKRDHGRRAADRHSRDRLAAVHLHRVRADVRSRRRRRLSVPPDGRSGRVRADRLLRAVAHAGATRWRAILLANQAVHEPRRARAADPQSVGAVSSAASSAASRRRATSIGGC